MRRTREEPSLERLESGFRCEEKDCYDLAVWLVTFNEDAFHWCLKHTRINMRDAERWSEMASAQLGA